MTATTVAKPGQHADGKFVSYPMSADTEILAGWAVMVGRQGTAAAGLAASLATATGQNEDYYFAGFAEEDSDNTGGLAGAKRLKVRRVGTVENLVFSGLSGNPEGSEVYMTDNQTATITATAAAFKVGYLVRMISPTQALVYYDVRDVPKLRTWPEQSETLTAGVALVYGTAGSGEITLLSQMLEIDPGGATRTVDLPDEAASAGQVLYVTNTADDAEDLTVQDSGGSGTIVTVGQNEFAILWCNGTAWRGLVGAAT